jgi:hypothetical protein
MSQVTLDINDMRGIARDTPPYMIPPEMWEEIVNMRVVDGAIECMGGWINCFLAPNLPDEPHFLMPVVNGSQTYWLWTSLDVVYAFDGIEHQEINRGVGGAYASPGTRFWNGTVFGGLPVLNNGFDTPQYWSAFDIATPQRLLPLVGWPSGGKIAVLRAFQNYLVGINYTVGGVNYPHMVKWSESVDDPGTIPQSWDHTDENRDAGEYDLVDVNSGILIDARMLGSRLFLYKERSTWAMRFIGGLPIFSFDSFSEQAGILAPRCVTTTADGRKHVVATQEDIIIHNGSSDPVSMLDKRMRRTLFNNIDSANYLNSFMFTHPSQQEVWFCYPEPGNVYPNRALVINTRTGDLYEVDKQGGVFFRNAASGDVSTAETIVGKTWATVTGTWAAAMGSWGERKLNRTIIANTDHALFHYLDGNSSFRSGESFSAYLRRTGLSLVGRKRTGEWIVNHEIYKFVDRLWPKIKTLYNKGEYANSERILTEIRIGTQETVDGPVTWQNFQPFNPSSEVVFDICASARAIAIEFKLPEAEPSWRLEGYRLSLTPDGQF